MFEYVTQFVCDCESLILLAMNIFCVYATDSGTFAKAFSNTKQALRKKMCDGKAGKRNKHTNYKCTKPIVHDYEPTLDT